MLQLAQLRAMCSVVSFEFILVFSRRVSGVTTDVFRLFISCFNLFQTTISWSNQSCLTIVIRIIYTFLQTGKTSTSALTSFSLCMLQLFELQSCFRIFFIFLFLIAQLTSYEPPDDQFYSF